MPILHIVSYFSAYYELYKPTITPTLTTIMSLVLVFMQNKSPYVPNVGSDERTGDVNETVKTIDLIKKSWNNLQFFDQLVL